MEGFKSAALCVGLVALVLSLAGLEREAQAQKTIRNSFQQSVATDSQNRPSQSVYGDYGQSSSFNSQRRTQQQQQGYAPAPVGQQQRRTQEQRQQTYMSRQSAVARPQPVYQQQQEQAVSSSSYDQQSADAEADAEPASYGAVQGSPGKDFPAYTRVPKTSFSCDGLPYDYGMYADEETGCQAYHVCYNGRKDSFLCGPGTVFNQRILHCDYWYSVDCGKSSQYYSSNAYMGSSQPEPGPAEANAAPQRPVAQSSYSRTQVASSSANRPSRFQPQQEASSSSFSRNTQQVQEAY